MRRNDREIKGEGIREIINECKVLRIGLVDDGRPYIVPMNFGYHWAEDSVALYMHCANEGRKIDILLKNPYAAFEMDCGHTLVEDAVACKYTYRYRSVMGEGPVEMLMDLEEKRTAFERIMVHQTGRAGFKFPDQALQAVTVLKLSVESISAKQSKG